MREIAWPEKAVARQGISRERDSIMDKIKEIKKLCEEKQIRMIDFKMTFTSAEVPLRLIEST